MKSYSVNAGSEIFIGAPAVPMPAERSAAIAKLVASVPEVMEAHLPQCYISENKSPPAQVLFVVFPNAIVTEAVEKIGSKLPAILPPGVFLDIVPISSASPLLETVRGANCKIHSAPINNAPWWKFWRGE